MSRTQAILERRNYSTVTEWAHSKALAHVLDELRPNAKREEWLEVLDQIIDRTEQGNRYFGAVLAHYPKERRHLIAPHLYNAAKTLAHTIRTFEANDAAQKN